jgi:hypothetical protein
LARAPLDRAHPGLYRRRHPRQAPAGQPALAAPATACSRSTARPSDFRSR